MYWAIGAIVVLVVVIILAAAKKRGTIEGPQRMAGRAGERIVTNMIRSVLREGDLLFTNVSFSYEGREAELDDVVVNRFGVFIIEAKYYSGTMYGSEDDPVWSKVHISRGGRMYEKAVNNPIRQVKREIYLLAKHLDYYGVSVWVDGYAVIVGAESQVDSPFILNNEGDIDRAIHTPGKKQLNREAVKAVKNLLEPQ